MSAAAGAVAGLAYFFGGDAVMGIIMLVVALAVASMLGVGTGLAQVYELRRAGSGPDMRTARQRFKDGLVVIIIWAGWIAFGCWAITELLNSDFMPQ